MLQSGIVEDVVCGVLREPVIRWSLIGFLFASCLGIARALRQIREDLQQAHTAGELHLGRDEPLMNNDGLHELIEASWMVLLFGGLLGTLLVIGIDPIGCTP